MSALGRARGLRPVALASALASSFVAAVALAQAPPVLPPPPPPPPEARPLPAPPSREVKRERESPRVETKPAPAPKRPLPDRPAVVEVKEVHEAPREVRDNRDTRDTRDLRESHDEPPPARTGFEVDLRTGITGPYGTIGNHTAMTDLFAAQLPFEVGLGARISPYVLIGGYAGLAFGGVSSAYASSCPTSCASFSARLGAQIQVHLRPYARLDPWLGYGIGYESSSVGGSASGADFGVGYRGIEVARFAGGLDIRVTRVFALGPLLEASFGAYTRVHTVAANAATDADVGTAATHGWFTLGARVTFLP